MKKFILLALMISTTTFANSSFEQFTGVYERSYCEGDMGSDSMEEGQIVTITAGDDWVNVSTPSLHVDYIYNDLISDINSPATKEHTENKYACINSTKKSTFQKNEVTQLTNFVSSPFCKGIPMAFGKIILKITNLGKGKISILNKHTMIKNYTCYYQKI